MPRHLTVGAIMTQFGKRTSSGRAGDSIKLKSAHVDVAAAVEAVKARKLPSWTEIGPARLFFAMCAVGAGLWFITATYAGNILRDIRFAGSWQPAYDLRADSGSCTRHNFILTICSAKITSLSDAGHAPIESKFMMGFSSGGGELLVRVRSTVDPSAVAIGYAVETKFMNRMLTFIVMTGTLVGLLYLCVSMLLQGRYQGGPAHIALLSALAELQARAGSSQANPRATA